MIEGALRYVNMYVHTKIGKLLVLCGIPESGSYLSYEDIYCHCRLLTVLKT